MRRTRLLPCLALLLLSCSVASAQSITPRDQGARQSAPPPWGSLPAGPDAVGFRTIYRWDTSRTWQATRFYDGRFVPDVDGRPVQLDVWYPAALTEANSPMRWRDYARSTGPAAFLALDAAMNARSREIAEDAVPPERVEALLVAPVAARRNAQAAPGLHPVVLYFGGLNAHPNANALMAEFLASHGYIVASISLLGETARAVNQLRTPDSIEATVRDMEFAWAALNESADLHPDRKRLAVMGHSLGAVEAVVFAMRNANVSAVVALGGTYGFRGSSSILTGTYAYAPENLRAGFFDVRRAAGQQDAVLDWTVVNSMRYADRTTATLEAMHHSDFTSFALIADAFQMPMASAQTSSGWNRTTARRGYELACELVLDFLDWRVKTDPRARVALFARAQRAEGVAVRHTDAATPVPEPWELTDVVARDGIPAARALLTKTCMSAVIAVCVDEALLNAFGYELLSQKRIRDATAIFEINAWAHASSANAQDSLADSYVEAGETGRARVALNAVIALAPADPSLSPEQKALFVSNATARLQSLR